MDSFARTVFGLLFGWMQTLASMIWSDFYVADAESLIRWIAEHWIHLVVILCVIGTATDIFIRIRKKQREKAIQRMNPESFPEEEEYPEEEPFAAAPEGNGAYFASNRRIQEDDETEEAPYAPAAEEEDEQGSWPAEPDDAWGQPVRMPEVTPAGYTVPADSPYRRPAVPAQQERDGEGAGTKERIDQIIPRRRRRRLVSGLFSDEEADRYAAPPPLIDRNEAYHAPVYPRKWKETENSQHEQDV